MDAPLISENDESQDGEASNPQSVSFRNYAPADATLEKDKGDENSGQSPLKRRKLDNAASASSKSALENALQEAKDEAASAVHNGSSKATSGEANVSSMAPKKLNWDLKRDIRSKLARLEKRTQRAIVEMLKERLEKEAAEQVQSDESDLD